MPEGYITKEKNTYQDNRLLDQAIITTLFVFVAFSMFSITITQIASGLGGAFWLIRTHLTGR